jgi:GNAT superfamily N-acetyltransferase
MASLAAHAHIRVAGPADAGALTILVESAYRGDSARRGWTHEADMLDDARLAPGEMGAMLADPDRLVLAAEAQGQLIGCVALARRAPGQPAYLGMLTVRPDLQSGGLGGRLMDAAEAHAGRAWGAPAIELWLLEGRDELAAWYRRRGYADSGRRQPFPGRSDYRFRVLLRPLPAAEEAEPAAPAPEVPAAGAATVPAEPRPLSR